MATKHFNHIAEFGNLVILSGNVSSEAIVEWCARNLKGPFVLGGAQLSVITGPKHSKINDFEMPISKTSMINYQGFHILFAEAEDLMMMKLKFDWSTVPSEFKK